MSPLVPPNSSTTTPNDFFCCRKMCIILLAAIVSGTKGMERMRDDCIDPSLFSLNSLLSRNISEEWM